ncbi:MULTISPECIES: hypothetical protein [unclassified Pseudomonas]|uniref:hypothetical protein n=1 Tax=unclassified Pseudomonas TaxID=196821 RepID=UPI000A1FD09C|nr:MULTISPECIES: hypothetical protein [unclassified Pseudomonas]
MPISDEALYAQLGQLITDMPDLRNHGWNTPTGQRWLGRATAILEKSGNPTDAMMFKITAQGLSSNPYEPGHDGAVQKMTAILYHALAVAELNAPANAQNGFIPVGEPFTAIAAVGGVMALANQSIFLVDPYAERNLLTDFAVQAAEKIQIRVLTDSYFRKPGLLPAAMAWIAQYGEQRPLEVRMTPAKSLHDRLIIVDGHLVWTVGQSFNGLGSRSPTALVRVNEETAQLKLEAYDQLWDAASPLV